MKTTLAQETLIDPQATFLLMFSEQDPVWGLEDFCGSILRFDSHPEQLPRFKEATLYLCGDLSRTRELDFSEAKAVKVIRELSQGELETGWQAVSLGQVPLNLHGLGIYYRRYFDTEIDYFHAIQSEHTFQILRESTKPGVARRTGIYLTPVKQDTEGLHFHLLRCSTNLEGPTENFQATDHQIINALNQEAALFFRSPAPLNHVLAQIYHNSPASENQKQSKAKISAHADKTKDMSVNGIMAFCTFYHELEKLKPLSEDPFDYGLYQTSGLTKLHFRHKAPESAGNYPLEFTLTLYPHSLFLMPLSTNRLYTHTIQSSMLDAEKLPTRLGYVVRCSKTEALHNQGQTFLKQGHQAIPLETPSSEGLNELRSLYREENKSTAQIAYGDQFLFSMNQGDYLAPVCHSKDAFLVYDLPPQDNLFEALKAATRFEMQGKGRQGGLLVLPNSEDLFPLVRTTAEFQFPAQIFAPVHEHLAQMILERTSLTSKFNNALIEIYNKAYTQMGSHSDLALDLERDSWIALYSCYQNPEQAFPLRKLVIEAKATGEIFEIALKHHCVVIFSVATNRLFRHKIMLEKTPTTPENNWLGVTFRSAKTFVNYRSAPVQLADGQQLHLATPEERQAFLAWRRRENQEMDFDYPALNFTLSPSDLLVPEFL